MSVFLLFCGAFAALCFSAFFSASETGFLSVSRERILHLSREGGSKAKRVQKALSDMGWTMTTILIGNNIANVSYSSATAALSGCFFADGGVGSSIWSFFAAFTVLYFSEFLPKLLCSARPLRRILLLSVPYSILSTILSPLTYIAVKLIDFFVPPRKTKISLTASDLMRILQDRKDGVCLSDVECALVTRIIVLRVKGKPITPESILAALRDDVRTGG